ncbi:MAG: outer membrane lipoprotein-sorting protein [Desulfobacterales bacterium]|jgi:hypothetical protein|nr:outer membrane lipoprotein-sorting protein [Desulfobacteraceae bacterium]MBT4363368.1 outer membrane lipoprotein-sorting protein [Desulfobacteraceae bacterium]MBT7086672.1 outer membrane lipoprotein-sorting protein [Desulfobacterales bacterium]
MNLRKNIRLFIRVICTVLLFSFSASDIFAETAYDFRKKVIDRYEGEDSNSRIVMKLQKIIHSKKDGGIKVKAERERKIVQYRKAYGKDDKIVMFFLEPADVRGTGFLSYVYDDSEKDNDQWLYLPALKKIKRIASGDKSGSFMGSDFSFVDVSDIKIDEYKHKFLTDGDLKGLLKEKSVQSILKKKFGKDGFSKAKIWLTTGGMKVVESIPVDKKILKDNGYSRIISWIKPDNLIIEKTLYFGKNKRAFKVRETIKSEKIQGIWSFTEMNMENFKKKHRTIIKFDDTKYNLGVKDSYFTQRTLERGL